MVRKRPHRRLVVVLLAALSMTAAAARAQVPPLPVEGASHTQTLGNAYRYDIKSLGIPSTAPLRRTIAGRFNDDPRADFVTLRGNIPILFVNPASWDAALRVPVQANDIAMAPRAGTHGWDALLTVSSAGLRAWTRRSDNDSFDVQALGRDQVWSDATLVRSAQLDGEHGTDIFGVRRDGAAAIFMLATEAGGFGLENPVALAAPPVDATAAAIGATSRRHVAFCSALGLHVFDPGLNETLYPVAANGVLTTVRDVVAEREAIVWLAEGAGGNDELYVIDQSGISAPLDLGSLDIVGVDAGDLDADGDDDLVLSRRGGHSLIALINRNGEFGVGSKDQRTIAIGPSGPAPDNHASPALTDLDGDGDIDLFFPIQSINQAFVLLNSRVNDRLVSPRLLQPILFNILLRSDGQGNIHEAGLLQARLRDAQLIPPGATHIELIVWRKQDLATPLSPAPQHASHMLRFPIDEDRPGYRTGHIALPDPEPSVFFWTQQYVTLDENGERTAMFPPGNYAFTVEWDLEGEILQWLVEENEASLYATTTPDPALQHGPPVTETLSTIVKVDVLISFDDDDEPEDDFDF